MVNRYLSLMLILISRGRGGWIPCAEWTHPPPPLLFDCSPIISVSLMDEAGVVAPRNHRNFCAIMGERFQLPDTVKIPPFMGGMGVATLLLGCVPVIRLALGSNGWFRRRLNRFLLLCLLRGSRRSSNCYWLRLSLGGYYFRFRGTTYDLLCWKHLEAVLSQVFQNAIAVSGCSPWDQDAIYPLVGNVAGVDAFRVARIRDFDEFNNLFIREGGSDMLTSSGFDSA